MAKLLVTDRDGTEHEIEGTIGWSLMEIAREAGLPIEAACGGCCACATCHVYVEDGPVDRTGSPDPDENMMLDEAIEVQDNSRLACQIKFTEALDGLKVRLGPEF